VAGDLVVAIVAGFLENGPFGVFQSDIEAEGFFPHGLDRFSDQLMARAGVVDQFE